MSTEPGNTDSQPKTRYYKQVSGKPYSTGGGVSNIYYKDCTAEVEAIIEAEKAKIKDTVRSQREIKLLDALYRMYVQYCSGKWGHQFMGAGETASELLEDAGYIVVNDIGEILKDNGDSGANLHHPTNKGEAENDPW